MVEFNFKPGDYVSFRLALEEVEGRVLESLDRSIVLVKLKSGYNIGLNRENILGFKVLRKFREEKKKFELPKTKGLPTIGIIMTGGTIASKSNPKTGGVSPLTNIGEFAKYYPEMFKIANVKTIEVPFMIASDSMNSEHWIKIAQTVKRLLDDKDISGVIVTHGTDTLGYSAAALSFFLRNLNKPVVLTYSQRSIDRASSDANLNLQCAARMAISDAAEVMIVGHASTNDDFCYAMPGTKTRKLHSSERTAFEVVNSLSIAKVWPDKVEFISQYRPRNDEKVELDVDFSDKVALVKYYPGQDSSILDFHALKYKGIIIEALGLGQIATSEASNNWVPKLRKLIREGFVVCFASQTIYGRLDPYVYSNARELLDAGVIFLEDMLSETALVKLGYILGHFGWKKEVKEKMLQNFAGELNNRISLK